MATIDNRIQQKKPTDIKTFEQRDGEISNIKYTLGGWMDGRIGDRSNRLV